MGSDRADGLAHCPAIEERVRSCSYIRLDDSPVTLDVNECAREISQCSAAIDLEQTQPALDEGPRIADFVEEDDRIATTPDDGHRTDVG